MKYTLKKDFHEDDCGKLTAVYGIECDDCAVSDISCNKDDVTRLIGLCNEYDLSPLHLNDIAEDFVNA